MRKCLVSFFAAILIAGMVQTMKADGVPAGVIVEEWLYTTDIKFDRWTSDSNGNNWTTKDNQTNASGRKIRVTDDEKTLAWGNWSRSNSDWSKDEGHSSLVLKSGGSGTINSTERNEDGHRDNKTAATLTHKNQAINTATPTPSYIDVTLTINLTPLIGAWTGSAIVIDMPIKFAFLETENVGSYQNDVFCILDGWDTVSDPFTVGNQTYDISLASNFTKLEGEYKNMIAEELGWDASKTIYGWTTLENKSTSFDIDFTVRHPGTGDPEIIDEGDPSATPEPATMLIMSLGLAGAGYVARRRKNA